MSISVETVLGLFEEHPYPLLFPLVAMEGPIETVLPRSSSSP